MKRIQEINQKIILDIIENIQDAYYVTNQKDFTTAITLFINAETELQRLVILLRDNQDDRQVIANILYTKLLYFHPFIGKQVHQIDIAILNQFGLDYAFTNFVDAFS